MKTYRVRVVFESDGDGWFASCPALEQWEPLSWGQSRDEAYKTVVRDLEITLGCMVESGAPIPEEPEESASPGENQVFVAVQPKLRPPQKSSAMKTYRFRVEMEPDEDVWFVRCPILERYGAATWGETQEQARKRIREVLGMVLETMLEEEIPIPEEPEDASQEGECLVVTL